ncbi:MAG: GTP-dependent nucleic acid-binding protein EngD [Parcubacteria group bacterium Gr01-1014_44]|nr:MAG: GTP-dependent nucleic acid-binding protein EngD [Parcubacteria group bacterium Gr01-1014_44]
MSLSIGIVGLPNVGKSTLFRALTKKQVDISNYPFTTISPNVGIVEVPDERLEILAKLSNSKKIVPTVIEFIDIAGLIKGAAVGEGLGNKFLANIREVNAIAQVVRVFEDGNIIHVHQKIDPANDIEVIKTELELADMESKEKREEKSKKERDLPPLSLLAEKKTIFVFNVSEQQLKERWQPHEPLLKIIGDNEYVILCNNFELLLSESSAEEQKIYLEEMGMVESGLDTLIKKSYHSLNLITFLTTGEDETRAWTTEKGTLIPKASRAIHTDFEKLFIRAEVIPWQKLVEAGSWGKARENGTLKLVGRDYIVQDGDVVEIKI